MKRTAIVVLIVWCIAPALFAGRPAKNLVTLHAAGIDIQEALRSLSRQAHINIAVPATLHRNVSIDVEREDPRVVLQQLVAQIKGSYCIEGNVIRVFRKPSQKCTARSWQPYLPLDR
jgi:type II secretory pathway component GspD/PulD (secretin)